jgi:hypothetical protein
MFLLKPIFKELFCVPAYRTRVVLHVMLSRFVCEDKIIFVAFPKPPRNLWQVLMLSQGNIQGFPKSEGLPGQRGVE